MSFHANYREIDRLAQRLRALAVDTVPAHNYNGRFSAAVVEANHGWFGQVFTATTEVSAAVSKVLDRAATLSDHSAYELTLAAWMYQTTDDETARNLDETY